MTNKRRKELIGYLDFKHNMSGNVTLDASRVSDLLALLREEALPWKVMIGRLPYDKEDTVIAAFNTRERAAAWGDEHYPCLHIVSGPEEDRFKVYEGSPALGFFAHRGGNNGEYLRADGSVSTSCVGGWFKTREQAEDAIRRFYGPDAAPPATETHAEAMKRLDPKPGDKFRVVRKVGYGEGGWGETWHPDMNLAIGGVITCSAHGEVGVLSVEKFGPFSAPFWFPATALERVEEEETPNTVAGPFTYTGIPEGVVV